MLTGKPPFSNLDNHMAVMFAVMKGNIKDQIPVNISPTARDFIASCVKQEPSERPTTFELLSHQWISGAAKYTPPPTPPTLPAVTNPATAPVVGAGSHGAKPGSASRQPKTPPPKPASSQKTPPPALDPPTQQQRATPNSSGHSTPGKPSPGKQPVKRFPSDLSKKNKIEERK